MKKIIQIKLINQETLNIEMEKLGSGSKTILFLHGGPGAQYLGFLDSFKPLSEQYTLIYFNQIGCGNSTSLPKDKYSISCEYEIINYLIDNYATSDVTILGESWGTFLGLGYFSKYEHKIKKLILCSSVGYSTKHFSFFQQGIERKITQTEIDKIKELTNKFNNHEITQIEFIKQRQNILEILYLYNTKLYSSRIRSTINFDQNAIVSSLIDSEMKLDEHLNKFYCDKIHWIQAQDDLVTPQNINDTFGKYMYHKLIQVSNCGHWIYFEQTQLLNNLITKIIK